jgi:hypothetical protein
LEEKYSFPKIIGIIFPENVKNKEESLRLAFDQEAFTYFLLQINKVQSIFEFCIIEPNFEIPEFSDEGKITGFKHNSFPSKDDNLFMWLDNSAIKFQTRMGHFSST